MKTFKEFLLNEAKAAPKLADWISNRKRAGFPRDILSQFNRLVGSMKRDFHNDKVTDAQFDRKYDRPIKGLVDSISSKYEKEFNVKVTPRQKKELEAALHDDLIDELE